MDRLQPLVAAARLASLSLKEESSLLHFLAESPTTPVRADWLSESASLLKLRSKVKDLVDGNKFSTASTGNSKLRVWY